MATIGMGGGGGGRNIVPAPPTSWSAAYGGKPVVPSPGASASTAIGSNLSNLSSILGLGQGVQGFTDRAALNQVRLGLPNYDALVAESSANILEQLQGEVPGDVVNQILRRAAERGIITGTVGSENANAAMLRALGLTSLDMTAMGEKNLTGAIARTPRGPIFDPSKMFISPADQQEAQFAANLYASAPDPQAAGQRAMGAASAGLNRGMASVPSSAGSPWRAAPSWEQADAASWAAKRDSWASYPVAQAYSNPSLQGQDAAPGVESWQDYLLRTFGSTNPAFAGQEEEPDTYYE